MRTSYQERSVIRVAGFLLPLLIMIGGCGLFDLRNPEDPTQTEEVPYNHPAEPQIALENLKVATEARFIGSWERALTEDYEFHFDFFDSEEVWTLNDDIGALTQLFNNEVEEIELTWTIREDVFQGEDRVYRNLGYRLVFRSSPTDSFLFGGSCNMYLREDPTDGWLIYKWEDIRDATAEDTWGYARLNTVLETG